MVGQINHHCNKGVSEQFTSHGTIINITRIISLMSWCYITFVWIKSPELWQTAHDIEERYQIYCVLTYNTKGMNTLNYIAENSYHITTGIPTGSNRIATGVLVYMTECRGTHVNTNGMCVSWCIDTDDHWGTYYKNHNSFATRSSWNESSKAIRWDQDKQMIANCSV